MVKGNRVAFNAILTWTEIPDEVESMVGTVFGRLARHPAVLRRITLHPYYHTDEMRNAPEGMQAPAKRMSEDMIDGIVKCTQFATLTGALESL